MKIFKVAYSFSRDNSQDIFKGFGFKHLSNATQFYVHPDNEQSNQQTHLAQPIGEAVILFSDALKQSLTNPDALQYYYDGSKEDFYMNISVPLEFRLENVVEPELFRYRIHMMGETITLGAYTVIDEYISGDTAKLKPQYKLMAYTLVNIAKLFETDESYQELVLDFIDDPSADRFVQICEDLYQTYKGVDYELEYEDIKDFNTQSMIHFRPEFEKAYDRFKKSHSTGPERTIEQFNPGEFTEEQMGLVPNLPEEFSLPSEFNTLARAIATGDVLSALLHGPAGTGKTMACKLIAQETGLPLMETINCTENLDEFILGKYIPKDDKIVFMESYVTKAIRNGGMVVFEEINFAKPQYLSFLNSLLDDNGFVRLDNGEVVRRNPNFRFMATMNMGYFGTRELNQALFNRFNAVLEVPSLSDDAIIRMLTMRVPECRPFVEKILAVYHKLQQKIESEELDVIISPRNLENWVRMAKFEGYKKAAEKTLVPIAKTDRSLEEAIRGIINVYRWK